MPLGLLGLLLCWALHKVEAAEINISNVANFMMAFYAKYLRDTIVVANNPWHVFEQAWRGLSLQPKEVKTCSDRARLS